MDERRSWVEPNNLDLSVREQCKILDLNRSNVYYTPRAKMISEEELGFRRLVDEIYTRYPFFGTRKMSDYITMHHHPADRYQVRKVYEALGLKSTVPGPHTSKPHPENKIYPYLLGDFKITAPMQVWSTDITYIRMRSGFMYLVAIIDWHSRYVLDWQLSNTLEAEFCIETLRRVLENGSCEIFNTDQGSQFTSNGFISVLKAHGVKISMDGKGRALDNVFVERLWRTVKYECVYLQEWESVIKLRQALDAYFQFYNDERPHQSLGGLTPNAVHGQIYH